MSTRKKQDKPAAEPVAPHIIGQATEQPTEPSQAPQEPDQVDTVAVTAAPAEEPEAAPVTDAATPTHVLVVANKRTGRYRAGRFWPPEPTRVAIDDIDDEGWAAIVADPALAVTPEV